MGKDGDVHAVTAKTFKGKRALLKRAPKLEEDAKRILILQGNKVSQTVKDVLGDIHKLKKGEAVKYDRKNDVHPFEPGQESTLQFFCERSECALFCLGHHSKKRPHNLVLGRMFNFQLLDMLEMGIERHTPVHTFNGARHVQVGAKPCLLFVGAAFEEDPACQLARRLLLDTFRGEPVTEMNLMSLTHVIVCFARDNKRLQLRHYSIHLKKSGTRVPRVELEDAGPLLDLVIRRVHTAPTDLASEAHKHPKLGKVKQKNVGFEELEGKVGRIYMPQQDLSTVSLAKGKGVKRARRDSAQERKSAKRLAAQGGNAGTDGSMDCADVVNEAL